MYLTILAFRRSKERGSCFVGFASKGAAIQYKYIWKQGGTTTYEGGSNRNYTVPTSGAGTRNDTWQP